MGAEEHLGPLRDGADAYDLTCAYTGPTPFGDFCRKPATMHVLWRMADGREGGSPACTPHGEAALQWGAVAHHSTTNSACCMPGSAWAADLSRCVLDDTGVEPVLSGSTELIMDGVAQ